MPTATASVTEDFLTQDIGVEQISLLPLDHPGAHDPAYRARRDYIASLARQYRQDAGHAIPEVDYTRQETAVWQHVSRQLESAHARRACSLYLEAKQKLGISSFRIPQTRELSAKLTHATGFRLAPIEGLVETRAFLSWLGKRTMMSTQYLRHHSRPDYTPEPDIVHEAIGHIPMFTIQDFADFSQFIGKGAIIASDEQLEQLGRLYWFTVEFGLIEEAGEIKAFGAGLLSSFSELEHAFSSEVERRPFVLEEVIHTSYSYSDMQPKLFVIPSYAYLKEVTRKFIRRFGKTGDLEVAPVGVPKAVW
ncbi:MAG: phenylalanine 4-monooxygenase [Acidobacteriota bacterium]|nr:phenylalanine 4-monooxygenase [Acidobacteriota bacterium]